LGGLTLAACPLLLSDPGMWPLLADPELLALVVIGGAVARITPGCSWAS
jgi:hypothetical protein